LSTSPRGDFGTVFEGEKPTTTRKYFH